jgi:hypothetical protein
MRGLFDIGSQQRAIHQEMACIKTEMTSTAPSVDRHRVFFYHRATGTDLTPRGT